VFKLNAEGGFGFADDVFVHAALVKQTGAEDGSPIRGTALLAWNEHRGRFGGRAVRVRVEAPAGGERERGVGK
jgi:hypothetical protein